MPHSFNVKSGNKCYLSLRNKTFKKHNKTERYKNELIKFFLKLTGFLLVRVIFGLFFSLKPSTKNDNIYIRGMCILYV